MQAGGLDRLGPLAGANQHLHQGLQLPLAQPLHLAQLQQGTAMASPPGPIGPGGQGRPTAPETDLGLVGRGNPLDRQFGLPGGQRRLHGPLPAGLKRTRSSSWSQRFDPDAPRRAHRPAGRRGSQALVVIGSRRISPNALMGRHRGLFQGPRPAAAPEGRPRGTPGQTLLLGRTVQARGMRSHGPAPAPHQGRGLQGEHRHGHGPGHGQQGQWTGAMGR